MATGTLTTRLSQQSIAAMDAVIKECALTHLDGKQEMERAFVMARGIRDLRALITDEAMKDVMQLQGTSLGFRTDKDREGGYKVDVVKDCLIEAALRGLRPVGNEWNIISGRVYVTKEGFARLVREFPGLGNLQMIPGVPRMKDGGALVTYKAKFTVDGVPVEIEREIPVKVNSGMGADAILGKATRKMLCAVYERLTGSEYSLPEGDVSDVVIEQQKSRRSSLTDSLPPEKPATPDDPAAEFREAEAARGDAREDA
jgi:hypothetical protein